MVRFCFRAAVVACTVLASVNVGRSQCCDAPCAGAAVAAAPCGPTYKTIFVTEWTHEQVPVTRTAHRMECRTEAYTAYRTECAPEVRTRTFVVNRTVPEVVTATRTVCDYVQATEQRTVLQSHVSYHPVTKMVCKTEDHGHFECVETYYKKKCCGLIKKPVCDPCCADGCKMEKKWIPCPVTIQVPVTTCEKHCETIPVTTTVTVQKPILRQETYQVTVYKCVPETRTENYTVMVPHTVPYQATRTVNVCVPYTETVMVSRCVPHQVAKQVMVSECGSCGGCGDCGASCNICCSAPKRKAKKCCK